MMPSFCCEWSGMHKLLCNNCGLVFKGFDPLGTSKAQAIREGQTQTSAKSPPRTTFLCSPAQPLSR